MERAEGGEKMVMTVACGEELGLFVGGKMYGLAVDQRKIFVDVCVLSVGLMRKKEKNSKRNGVVEAGRGFL